MVIKRDQAFHVVCNIRTSLPSGAISTGTGLFVTPNKSDAYLVTASHVARSTNASTILAVQGNDGKCITVRLSDLAQPTKWINHEKADMSVIKLGGTSIASFIAEGRCLPSDCLNLEETPPSRDDELTAIGFPNGLGVDGLFSPLTFRSYASSSFLTLNRADTQTPPTFFCLENPSVGGYSGCPVMDLGYMVSGFITQTKDRSICHGIMHGTMSDNTGGKIALVTPMFYIKDLLPSS